MSLSPYICSSYIRMPLGLPCWTQAHSCSHTLNLDLKSRAWTLACSGMVATYAESEGVGVPPQLLHEPYLQESEQLGLGCVGWRVHLDTLLGGGKEERRGKSQARCCATERCCCLVTGAICCLVTGSMCC